MIQTPVKLCSKLADVGTTIFTVISQLSDKYNAINLSQGAPDFSCDPILVDKVSQAMRSHHNQYAPMSGYLPLKENIAEKITQLYGCHYDPKNEITITASASEALYAAISALVHPRDEVIFFEPSFDSYAPAIRLQGAIPVGIKLSVPEFNIDWNAVRAAITSRTRMIILNTPHNPSGQVFSRYDRNELAKVCRNTNIIILSDEVYEHMTFDGMNHMGMATDSELASRSVIVSSFGKTFHVTGWRVGYCVAPNEIMQEILKVHQFMMFSADTPMQYAFAQYMRDPQTYLHLSAFYQAKRDLLVHELKDGPFKLLPSKGSFFILASFAHLSEESDTQVVTRLIKEFGVATIPLSAFYSDGTDNHFIRLSFAKEDQTLIRGARALNRFI